MPLEEIDPLMFGREQPCFGCSPNHPIGLKLRFWRDDNVVITRFCPDDRYQGPPGILHGGLVTTVADELAAWTIVVLRGRMGFTASLDGRFRGPIRIGKEVEGRGEIVSNSRRIVSVKIGLAQEGQTRFEGNFTFALLDRPAAERLIGDELPPEWQRFCLDA
jgi:acyl-coenzyme A thioesterase PaaI-like protein